MKDLDCRLQRLFRAAATVDSAPLGPSTVPSGRWLLSQREKQSLLLPTTVGPVLRGGLALACVILVIALVVNLRVIGQVNQDVFAVSQTALIQASTP